MIKTPEDFANALSAYTQPVPYSSYADYIYGAQRHAVSVGDKVEGQTMSGRLGIELVDFIQLRPLSEARFGMAFPKDALLEMIMTYFKETQPDNTQTASNIIDAIQEASSQALTATIFDEEECLKKNDVRHRTCLSSAVALHDMAITFGAASPTGQKAIQTLLDLGDEATIADISGFSSYLRPIVQAGYINALSAIAAQSKAGFSYVAQAAAEKGVAAKRDTPAFAKLIGIEVYNLFTQKREEKKEKLSEIFSTNTDQNNWQKHVNSLIGSIPGPSMHNYMTTTVARLVIADITDAAIVLDRFLKFITVNSDPENLQGALGIFEETVDRYNQNPLLTHVHPGLIRAQSVIDTRLRNAAAGFSKPQPLH